jgi:hypothetical protein
VTRTAISDLVRLVPVQANLFRTRLTVPGSSHVITHTPLTTSSEMARRSGKLGRQGRSGLDGGDAVHQGRPSRVVDVPFAREPTAALGQGSGLAVVLVGFRGGRVEGAVMCDGRKRGVNQFSMTIMKDEKIS